MSRRRPAGTAPLPTPAPTDTRSVQLTHCPDGPLLLRGADEVRDSQGQRHRVERPVVAICVCGKSARQPWCDGTHKVIPRRR